MATLLVLLLFLLLRPSRCFNHWVVTEEGKIEYQVASPFNLRQPFDLMALIQQERRVSILKELREELIDYKNEFESYSNYDNFDESFRALDPECQNIQLISSYDLYISTVLPLEHKGISFMEYFDIASDVLPPGEPFCTTTPLDFSMYAMEHLEGVHARRSLVAPPEKSVLTSVGNMRMNAFGSRIYHALEKNATSWVLLDLATLYWRAKGNPLNAVECIRRALHYSPEFAMDIALLNLANILHRSNHSRDATVSLHVAISLSPDVNVLHYTLGNIYAALNQLNESVRCFKRCRDLKSDCETSRAMYQATLCELKMEEVSRERSDKLDQTQRKLDQFYENMDTMRQNQYIVSKEEEIGVARLAKKRPKKKSVEAEEPATDAMPITDPNLSITTEKDREKIDPGSSSELSLEEALDAAVRNTSVGDGSTSSEEDKLDSEKERDKLPEIKSGGAKPRSKLRLVLKPLPNDEEETGEYRTKREGCCHQCGDTCAGGQDRTAESAHEKCTSQDSLVSNGDDGASSCRDMAESESQLPLPSSSADSDVTPPTLTTVDVKETLSDLSEALECATGEGRVEKCQQMQQQFQEKRKTKRLKLTTITESSIDGEEGGDIGTMDIDEAKKPKKNIQDGHELSMFDRVEFEPQFPRDTDRPKASGSDPTKLLDPDELIKAMNNPPPREYPQMYYNLEFLPYNPIPERLDSMLFPFKESPLPLYDDPYWPMKKECLNLLGEIRAKPNYVAFTGTFITPEARGADVSKLFASVPLELPYYMQRPPRCTDIVELPYSMAAMDHLQPIMYRNNFRTSLEHGEKGLKKVLIHAVTGDLKMNFSFEESGHRAYAAMLKNGPNWVLFNIASLYWRVVGDPSNAIECLRRAIHYAPDKTADVGYVGVANVLHRVGYLSEAVIAVRAALDTHKESPVCHYTLASIYLSLHDYVASTIHLRAALHAQSSFDHALSALKLVRCSMKFKEEKAQLRKKMQEEEDRVLKEHEEQLLKDLKAAVQAEKEGRKITRQTKPAIVLENREPPEIPEFKMEETIASNFTGEDAIWYMFRLSLFNRMQKKRREEKEMEEANELKKALDNADDGAGMGHSGNEVDAGEKGHEAQVNKEKREGQSSSSDASKNLPPPTSPTEDNRSKKLDTNASSNKDSKAGGVTKKSKSKKPRKKQVSSPPPPPPPRPIDNQQSYERDPEVERILNEVVETLNRNQTPVQRKIPSRVIRRSSDHFRDAEEIRIRHSPKSRPWPSLDECQEKPQPKYLVFTSTWLSVTAKGVNVREHIDFTSPLEHYPILPYCHNNFDPSRKTLDHLTGMNSHPLMQYKAEKGLQEVLCTLDGRRRSVEEMATRIKLALDKNSTSWVLSNLAALYWRVVGQGQLAIKCLKHALYYSNEYTRDVALVSLSNVLYRSGFDKDATAVIHMSLEASPTMVVTHFTMANILAAQGFYVEAAGFYESTLNFQPEFKPAADRLKTVRCLMLIAKNQHLKERDKKQTIAANS